MRHVVFMMLMALTLAGCRFTQSGGSEGAGYRNEPSDREEAQQLMAELDDKAASEHWDAAVVQRVREQMRGRLLAAGLSGSEVDEWVQANTHIDADRMRGDRWMQ